MPNKIKYKLHNKGWLSQKFGENKELYTPLGYPGGHHGIDTVNGWGKPILADNPGLIYKIRVGGVNNTADVFQLVKVTEDTFIEVGMAHFSRILIKEGDMVPEGTRLGDEGNRGIVYSGGGRITTEMQLAGDRRGTHLHLQIRPVQRVKIARAGKHYLNRNDGTRYKDDKGYLYEILQNDNGFKGCVDPMQYNYKNTMVEDIQMIGTWMKWWASRKK